MKRVLIFSVLFSNLPATTINIPSDYTTIQEGINASVDGDTVLIAQGTYYENLILEKEIVLASHAINDDLESDWLNNENIHETIISGVPEPIDPNKGSCLVIRYGNIAPTITGLTFQDGIGTSMVKNDCIAVDGSVDILRQELSGGAILIYKAYPTIMYNRFIDNGNILQANNVNAPYCITGGAISHYDTDDVEFDEDRNNTSQNTSSTRTVPDEINIQNNYFENNSSGDGENFYSHGYEGTIDVSYSIFDDIDCASNNVNEYVLKSRNDYAEYIQNEISGNCIEGNSFYVSIEGDNNNQGSESAPLKTIGHALSLVRDDENTTTYIYVREGVYSPSTTGEQFPIVLPDNVHLIGEEMENSILDAEADANNERRVIIIEECNNVRVANMTITGGFSEGAGCIGGGGILITYPDTDPGGPMTTSTPVLENLIITENHSLNGGGVSIFRQSGPTLTNVIVSDNTATGFGGGIFSFFSNTTMTDVAVSGNETFEYEGGGIVMAASGGTITNATITDNTSGMNGGGVFITGAFTMGGTEVSNLSEWTMTNVSISGNTAAWNGGAMALWDGAVFSLTNVIITGNTAGVNGGAMALWDGTVSSLTNVTISGNTAGGYGGAFYASNSNPTLTDVTITGNTAESEGGGMYLYLSDPTLTHSTISNNTASQGGGMSLDQSNATLTHVTLSNNICVLSNYSYYYSTWGGGMYLYLSDPTLTHVTISGNTGGDYGGGMSLTTSNPILTHVTISGNTADYGGGIELYDNSDATLINSIIWDNSPESILIWDSNTDAAITTYSDIEGGWEGEGNINADPLFTEADNGDYTLQSNSPCIDTGTADIDGDGEEDITDYFGLAPDMGAFEFVIAGPTGLQFTIEDTSVTLTWDPITDDNLTLMFYKVDRSTDSLFTTDLVANIAHENFFIDNDLEWDTEYYYRVTAFFGFWSGYSDVISVILNWMYISDSDGIPTSYKIHQNYPNPFNPVTTLRYDLPEDAVVNITIYDMMGRQVRTLVSSQQTVGYKSVLWNATNDAGSPVSAGLYFYMIQAGEFRQTRKMVLVK